MVKPDEMGKGDVNDFAVLSCRNDGESLRHSPPLSLARGCGGRRRGAAPPRDAVHPRVIRRGPRGGCAERDGEFRARGFPENCFLQSRRRAGKPFSRDVEIYIVDVVSWLLLVLFLTFSHIFGANKSRIWIRGVKICSNLPQQIF